MMYSTHFVNGYMASEGQIKVRVRLELELKCPVSEGYRSSTFQFLYRKRLQESWNCNNKS